MSNECNAVCVVNFPASLRPRFVVVRSMSLGSFINPYKMYDRFGARPFSGWRAKDDATLARRIIRAKTILPSRVNKNACEVLPCFIP